MRIVTLHFIVLILISYASCNSNKSDVSFIKSTYTGYFAETEWTYDFNEDGSVVFKGDGHIGNVVYPCTYHIYEGMIYVQPESDFALLNGVLRLRLKLVDSGCLRDNQGYFYCDDLDVLSYKSDSASNQINTMIEELEEMKIVEDEISKIDTSIFEHRIFHDGIIQIEGSEYAQFTLRKFDIEDEYPVLFLYVDSLKEIYVISDWFGEDRGKLVPVINYRQ